MKEAKTLILGRNDLSQTWRDTPIEDIQTFHLLKIREIYGYDLVIFVDEDCKCNVLVNKFGIGGVLKYGSNE